jgi:hypothetical protein
VVMMPTISRNLPMSRIQGVSTESAKYKAIVVAAVADRGPVLATPGRDGALRRPGHRSAMSLPLRSRYVVANALDHPIDS